MALSLEELNQAYINRAIDGDTYKMAIRNMGGEQAADPIQSTAPSQATQDPLAGYVPTAQEKRTLQFEGLRDQFKLRPFIDEKKSNEEALQLASEAMVDQDLKNAAIEKENATAVQNLLQKDELENQAKIQEAKKPGIDPAALGAQQSAKLPTQTTTKEMEMGKNTEQARTPLMESSGMANKYPGIDFGGRTTSLATNKVYKEMEAFNQEYEQKFKEAEALRVKHQEIETNMQAKAEDEYKGLVDASTKFNNSNQIQPNRYWANASTGAKMSAMLSAAFSGFAQAYIGGRNVGLDQINKLADDDIRAQQLEYEQSKDKLNAKQSLYSTYMGLLKDTRAANLATRAAVMDNVIQKLQVMGSKMTIASKRDELNLKAEELQAQKAKLVAEVTQKVGEKYAYQSQAQKILVNPNAKFDDENLMNPTILSDRIKDNKATAFTIGNNVYVTGSEKRKDEMLNASATRNQMDNILTELASVQTKGFTKQVARDEFTRLKGALLAKLKQKETLGSLDKGLVDYADKLFSGIEYTNFLGDSQKAIASYKNQIDKEFTTLANSVFSSGAKAESKQDVVEKDLKIGRSFF
jgi:hypothetical protein